MKNRTNQRKKKNKEKSEGMHLLRRFGLSPDSPNVDFDREKPDYTFCNNDIIIGVEITVCLTCSEKL